MPAPSYLDLMRSQCLPHDYRCPAALTRLSTDERHQLVSDPLTPVPQTSGGMHMAQLVLLESFSRAAAHQSLREYTGGLCQLSAQAWRQVMLQLGATPTREQMLVEVQQARIGILDVEPIGHVFWHYRELVERVTRFKSVAA